MSKLFSIFCFFAILISATTTMAQIDFRGSYEANFAVELDGGDTQKFEHILKPEFTADITDDIRLFGLARLRYDMVDELVPIEPRDEDFRSPQSRRVFLEEDGEFELRELYIDGYMGDLFYRLGKQQIVWGQADGLRVLDIVNPFDFREFILPDFEDYRIPLWTVNVEVPIHEWTMQLLWIPDQTYDQVEALGSGANYEFSSPLVVPQAPSGTTVTINKPDRPDRFFSDSDAGMRLTTFKNGWDLSLNYLYHYQDTQVLRRTLDSSGAVIITPGYERTHLIGGTFSNAFGDYTLRGEVGYSTHRYFITSDLSDPDGVVETPELGSVIGVDYQGIRDVFLSGQLFTNHLTEFEKGMNRDETDTQLTFLYEHNFINDTVTIDTQIIQSLNDGDGLIQFALEYDFRSNVILKAGADFFYGNKDGLFGQFKNNDRVTLGMEIGF